MVAEGKITLFWIAAIIAAALIDTTPELNLTPICETLETSKKESDLIDQLNDLNERIDSLTYVFKHDTTLFIKN